MDSATSPTADSLSGVHPEMRVGLELLLQGHVYASELRRSIWDLAVEISSLREAGLTNNDLRWLICKGLVEHAREITTPGHEGREFRPTAHLTFSKRSCFVLTPKGVRAAGLIASSDDSPRPHPIGNGELLARGEILSNGQMGNQSAGPRPQWNRELHELRLDGVLVKIFRLPSPNQETILMAFEEEGWPPRIDDPLPPVPDVNSKQRLHDTIKSLNRNQKVPLLRFMGDGTGTGVRWARVMRRPAPTANGPDTVPWNSSRSGH